MNMQEEFSYASKQEYSISNMQENIEMIVYSACSFALPFLLGHPQLIVGVLVNSALVLAALNLKGTKMLPVIILPCLGVLLRGVIFGPFTVYLIYMIPFIWLGNFTLVYLIKELFTKRRLNRWLALITGSLAKADLLFGIAFGLVSMSVVPAIFLTTMGVFQLYTAILGGAIAFGVQAVKRRMTAGFAA